MKRHETILQKDQTAFVVVDYQERLASAMLRSEETAGTITRLINGMKILGVPVLATEQYPKGLGPTVSGILQELQDELRIEKLTFSCCGSEKFFSALLPLDRKQVIVTGIEAHVCVLQTALDLLANGFQPHVPFDAVTSRNEKNYEQALRRMENAGVTITNSESVLFELMAQAGTPEFKAVQKLVV